jgi:hypothetical protein
MKRILTAALLFIAAISQVSAAIVTSISNLQIGTNYYDVTIHSEPGSFNDIWDIDGDGVFGEGDGSLINRAPMFWGDSAGAQAAAQAVTNALGSNDAWSSYGYDGTFTPYQHLGTAGDYYITVWADVLHQPDEDQLNGEGSVPANDVLGGSRAYAYVSYEKVGTVPLPAAVWLFLSALTGLGLISKRKNSKT